MRNEFEAAYQQAHAKMTQRREAAATKQWLIAQLDVRSL